METPVFIEADLEEITAAMIADFETKTGKTLEPAHPERLLIDTFAYREYLLRVQFQEACLQNLVDFANAPMLDYLGALVGVFRYESLYAQTVLKFTKNSGGGDIDIPEGTAVEDADGNVFKTIADLTLLSAGTEGYRTARAVVAGTTQNGLATGAWSLVTSISGVTGVENTISTYGGDSAETDDRLRQRIKEGPAKFSAAGSEQSYIYWTKTLQPLVIDASVAASSGTVTISVLMYDGEDITAGQASDLQDLLNGDTIRPLTDTVVVQAATKVSESVEVVCYIYETSVLDATDIQTAVEAKIQAYCDKRRQTLGLDAIAEQIIHEAMSAAEGDIYEVNCAGGFVDQVMDPDEFCDLSFTVGPLYIVSG